MDDVDDLQSGSMVSVQAFSHTPATKSTTILGLYSIFKVDLSGNPNFFSSFPVSYTWDFLITG
jgi:hypothetical protein